MSRRYAVALEAPDGTHRETVTGYGNTRKTAKRHAASVWGRRHEQETYVAVRIEPIKRGDPSVEETAG